MTFWSWNIENLWSIKLKGWIMLRISLSLNKIFDCTVRDFLSMLWDFYFRFLYRIVIFRVLPKSFCKFPFSQCISPYPHLGLQNYRQLEEFIIGCIIFFLTIFTVDIIKFLQKANNAKYCTECFVLLVCRTLSR